MIVAVLALLALAQLVAVNAEGTVTCEGADLHVRTPRGTGSLIVDESVDVKALYRRAFALSVCCHVMMSLRVCLPIHSLSPPSMNAENHQHAHGDAQQCAGGAARDRAGRWCVMRVMCVNVWMCM